jgi:hypothetical protein
LEKTEELEPTPHHSEKHSVVRYFSGEFELHVLTALLKENLYEMTNNFLNTA